MPADIVVVDGACGEPCVPAACGVHGGGAAAAAALHGGTRCTRLHGRAQLTQGTYNNLHEIDILELCFE